MNKTILLAAFVCSMFFFQTANAQDPVTTLQHAGTTKVFYGTTSLYDAYNASVDGDSLLLSVGGFTPPPRIEKNLTVIGAGHFPDSGIIKKRTSIFGNLIFYCGADSLHLEGLYINGTISNSAYPTSYSPRTLLFLISRCRFKGGTVCSPAIVNNITLEDNFIEDHLALYGCHNNCIVKHNIISYYIDALGISNAIFENNLFLANGFLQAGNCLVRNNIFLKNTKYSEGSNNICYNNLLVSDFSYPKDYYTGALMSIYNNNYLTIPVTNIFANQIGDTIDYSQDYHMISPSAYIGTDGTQVGLYGGLIPFKDGGYPSNPQIITKSVSTQTDASGNLNISFKVKAQDN